MSKVLIVEDDQALRDVFSLIVRSDGYEVEVAEDGAEGLQKLNSFSPDIVLLDMLMPVKSGLEFMQEANMSKTHPDTTVVILSNLSESGTIDQALKLGAVKHMIKSDVSPDMLLAELRALSQA